MPEFLKQKTTLLFLAIGALIMGAGFYLQWRDSAGIDAARRVYKEGETLPSSMGIRFVNGGEAKLESYQGKVVLLNFWASWCAPCLKEMPSMYKLQQNLADRGFQVLAISMDDVPAEGERALNRLIGVPPFPLLDGNESEITNSFPIVGLPYSVVIDRKGKIQYAQPGELDWLDPKVVRWVETLL